MQHSFTIKKTIKAGEGSAIASKNIGDTTHLQRIRLNIEKDDAVYGHNSMVDSGRGIYVQLGQPGDTAHLGKLLVICREYYRGLFQVSRMTRSLYDQGFVVLRTGRYRSCVLILRSRLSADTASPARAT